MVARITDAPRKLGEMLRDRRGRHSIEAMAKRLGVNKNTLGAYERHEWLPEIDFLANFAAVTGTEVWPLLDARMRATDEGGMSARPESVVESILRTMDEPVRRIFEAYGIDPTPAARAGRDAVASAAGRSGSVPVLGLAECGLKGWYQPDPMTVRAMRPGDLPGDGAFATIAVGDSMRPAGIEPGFLCFCAPVVPADPGDIVFVERRTDKAAALKLYGREDASWVYLQGWLPPDAAGHQAPYTEQLNRAEVVRLAPVVYVKRKL